MMRLQTYAALSMVATMAVIYHAFSSRVQFYPATVYLSTSKISLVLLLNMSLVIMCILWQLTKAFFLGSLREAEVERLNEQSWREVMEILFAITIFRQDFSVAFLAMVTALLLIKALHWLAQKRVEYIETTPSVPLLSHIRIVSFMAFLLLVDSLFFYNSVKFLIQTRQASVSLFFAFEYMILATTTVSTFVKYVFYVSDMLMEGQWERKAVYTFYLELIRDLLHLSMYLCFFLVIFMNYGIPLHLIRELYETFRNFKIRIADYMRYRRITSNMNDRFPDATPEELDESDATCIICREEMTTAKKLLCGHLFHVHCLRSWLERQNTCPTCRAPVVPAENGTASSSRQHQPHSNSHQQGSTTSSTISQGSVVGANLQGHTLPTGHQARIQAAAAAASLYEKSFVYPSANTLTCIPGYACVPGVHTPLPVSSGADSSGQRTSVGHERHFMMLGGLNSELHSHFPQYDFIPVPAAGLDRTRGDGNSSEVDMSGYQVEAQKSFLVQRIELLQKELELLQKPNPDGRNKGKAVASAPTDCGHRLEDEE
ncbi:hypothetical protein SAY87_027118 [Trapa incisa]|uniref:RING-type E3 ubiquitin transferase n=1 Tax=Trapa incisa TaxID=236973 RepID=A0AAN7H230_9MYRT|nr:hypothetical protein SAY87_027118 [Trapa incisa]